jgi:hypothetical protein
VTPAIFLRTKINQRLFFVNDISTVLCMKDLDLEVTNSEPCIKPDVMFYQQIEELEAKSSDENVHSGENNSSTDSEDTELTI